MSPLFGSIRPAAVSHHETVSGTAHQPFTHVPSLTALMQPSQSIHMMEVWPHAHDEFCCLVPHHFRAIPTPRTSMTASCRSHPACKRLTTGGVPPSHSLFFCVFDGRREHHRLRLGEMSIPALPPDLTGCVNEECPCGNAGVSGATFMSPSPHAIGLTPGSRQVHVSFPSLPAAAFPIGVEGRRVSRHRRVSPATGLSW